MYFAIVRTNDADDRVMRRTTLPPTVTTMTAAIAALESELASEYDERGRDDEQFLWWARKNGEQFTFYLADPQPIASSLAHPAS
jgi:hypothetical protein